MVSVSHQCDKDCRYKSLPSASRLLRIQHYHRAARRETENDNHLHAKSSKTIANLRDSEVDNYATYESDTPLIFGPAFFDSRRSSWRRGRGSGLFRGRCGHLAVAEGLAQAYRTNVRIKPQQKEAWLGKNCIATIGQKLRHRPGRFTGGYPAFKKVFLGFLLLPSSPPTPQLAGRKALSGRGKVRAARAPAISGWSPSLQGLVRNSPPTRHQNWQPRPRFFMEPLPPTPSQSNLQGDATCRSMRSSVFVRGGAHSRSASRSRPINAV